MKKFLTISIVSLFSLSTIGCSYIQQGIDIVKSKEVEQRIINLSEEEQLEKHNNILKYGSKDKAFLHFLYKQNYSKALIYYEVEFVKYMYPYIQSLSTLYNKENPNIFQKQVNQSLLLANDQNLNSYIEKQLKMLDKTESYCELIYPSMKDIDSFLKHMKDNPKDFISVIKKLSIFDMHYKEIIFNLIDYNEILFTIDKESSKKIHNYLINAYIFDDVVYYEKLKTMNDNFYK